MLEYLAIQDNLDIAGILDNQDFQVQTVNRAFLDSAVTLEQAAIQEAVHLDSLEHQGLADFLEQVVFLDFLEHQAQVVGLDLVVLAVGLAIQVSADTLAHLEYQGSQE